MSDAINGNIRGAKRFAIEETTLRELSPTEIDAVAGARIPWETITVTVTVTESSALCTTILIL
jgi:hypothetical protein